jgi:short-subunit dehydrogenase
MSNTNRIRLVITGATGGIGRELLKAMNPYIDFVILNGLNLIDLRQTQNDLGLKNGVCIAGDVSNSNVRDQIYQAAELNGGINLLINNAGMNDFDFFQTNLIR